MNNIDTSTTAGKIAVMQAFEDKRPIEYAPKVEVIWRKVGIGFRGWNWVDCKYRIKPQTVEEAAKIYAATPKASLVNQAAYDFTAGAQWQKDQDNE